MSMEVVLHIPARCIKGLDTKNKKQESTSPVIVSSLLIGSVCPVKIALNLISLKSFGFSFKLKVLKEVTAVDFYSIQSQLPSEIQLFHDDVVTGEEIKHFCKLFLLLLIVLVHISRSM